MKIPNDRVIKFGIKIDYSLFYYKVKPNIWYDSDEIAVEATLSNVLGANPMEHNKSVMAWSWETLRAVAPASLIMYVLSAWPNKIIPLHNDTYHHMGW